MRKPEITLENYPAVYDYYRQRKQNKPVSTGVYWLLDKIYKPRIEFAPGAEDQWQECIDEGRGIEVAINHTSYKDPQVLGGVVWRTLLRQKIGDITVLAKKELFVGNGRPFFDMTGGLPVFRPNDHDDGLLTLKANQKMLDTSAEKLAGGGVVGIFPEGTVNRGDRHQLGTVYSGVGHVACRAAILGGDPRIATIGLDLGPDHSPSSASVYVGNIMRVQDIPQRLDSTEIPSVSDVTRFVTTDLQHSVEMAGKAY